MKKVFFIAMFSFVCIALSAQQANDKGGRERLYMLQAEQIAKDLDIKAEIKQQFMDLYLSYAEASQRKGHPGGNRPQGAKPQGEHKDHQLSQNLSEEQIEQRVLQSFEMSIKAIELKKAYYYKFRKFLSPRQINKMYEAERRFRSRILHEQMRRE